MFVDLLSRVSIIILGAVLLILSFPEPNLYLLVFVSFIPFFYVLENTKHFWESLIYGFIYGVFFVCGSLWWLLYAGNYVRLATTTKIIIGIFVIFYLTIPFLTFSLLYFVFKRLHTKLLNIFILPSIWISIEFFYISKLLNFPWLLLGASQYRNTPFIQLADITGIYGISFLIILINYLIFKLIFSEKERWLSILAIFLIFAFVLGYGYFRINRNYSSPNFSVCFVQAQKTKTSEWWNPHKFEEAMKSLMMLSSDASMHKPYLIIWPEGSVPFSYQFGNGLREILEAFFRRIKIPILFGGAEFDSTSGRITNTAFLFLNGRIANVYRKQRLAPLGEYLPNALSLLKDNLTHISPCARGQDSNLMRIGNIQFGVYICGEAIFPDLVRNFTKKGALFLVNITNDSVLSKRNGIEQHFMHSVFRAIENRRWIIRCSSSGISSFISPKGKIVSKTEIFEEVYKIGNIELINNNSFYTRFGDIFSFFAVGFTLLSLLNALIAKLKNED